MIMMFPSTIITKLDIGRYFVSTDKVEIDEFLSKLKEFELEADRVTRRHKSF